MRVALLSALVIGLAVAGCGSKSEDCVFGASQASAPTDRPAIHVPQDLLDEHAPLANLLARPDLAQGIGATVECKEGRATMEDLSDAGANVKPYGDAGQDTFIFVEEGTYHLYLSQVIRE